MGEVSFKVRVQLLTTACGQPTHRDVFQTVNMRWDATTTLQQGWLPISTPGVHKAPHAPDVSPSFTAHSADFAPSLPTSPPTALLSTPSRPYSGRSTLSQTSHILMSQIILCRTGTGAMWVLSTDRAELHFFPSPAAIPGGYAILSHAWGDNEQTFQETRALEKQCKEAGKTPRDLSSEKVRECCKLAERYGYHWLWDDTCCIDKTSSTELSEAINSMFIWYSCAEMCFAYLADVDSGCDLHAEESAFRTARWHSRGWTLQELIASIFVIFVARDWKTIGTKKQLAPLLEEVTGVPRQVLTREAHFSAVSVAERMLWASKRSTTRVEDEAYCLMGLFNVNMPTLYGEGRQAFYRLQQEIMKQSIDTSLFAWGGWVEPEDGMPLELQGVYKKFSSVAYPDNFLLAPSPKRFRKPFERTVHYTPSAQDPLQPYLDQQRKANAVRSNLRRL